MNKVVEDSNTFRVRSLAPRDGETKGLQSGDSIFFKLTRSGTPETHKGLEHLEWKRPSE